MVLPDQCPCVWMGKQVASRYTLHGAGPDVLAEAEALVSRLEQTPVPRSEWLANQRSKPDFTRCTSIEERQALSYEFELRIWGRALDPAHWHSEAKVSPDPHNDLSFNLLVVERQLADLLELGTWPAPAYAKRLRILLRRAGQAEVARRFEDAWTRINRGTDH